MREQLREHLALEGTPPYRERVFPYLREQLGDRMREHRLCRGRRLSAGRRSASLSAGPGLRQSSGAKNLLRTGQKPPDIPCHGCRGQMRWKGKDGHWICGICHPPAHLNSAEQSWTKPMVKLATQESGE